MSKRDLFAELTTSLNEAKGTRVMNKEDRLYKLSQGSDTAMWAHDEIIKQDKRIAELEAENTELKGALTALRQRKGNRVILMDKIPEPPKEQGE